MPTSVFDLDLRELRAALARQGKTQWQLAAEPNMSPSCLSAYLRSRSPAPPDLARRIATALGVSEHALARESKQNSASKERAAADELHRVSAVDAAEIGRKTTAG